MSHRAAEAEEDPRPQWRRHQAPASEDLVEQQCGHHGAEKRRHEHGGHHPQARDGCQRAHQEWIARQMRCVVGRLQPVRRERVVLGHVVQRLGQIGVVRAVPVAIQDLRLAREGGPGRDRGQSHGGAIVTRGRLTRHAPTAPEERRPSGDQSPHPSSEESRSGSEPSQGGCAGSTPS